LKRQSNLIITSLVFLLLLASGCSNTEKTAQATTPEAEIHTKENQMQHKEQPAITNEKEAEKETAAANDLETDQDSETETDTEGTKTTEEEMALQIQDLKAVGSSDEAVALLSNNLGITENEDLEFDLTAGGEVTMDGTGNYYTLILKSKSMIENGGSGTAGIYRVYEDGTIIDEYAEGSQ
jgi:outer membrane murein-binding lipoprotein Lpp